MEGSANTHTKNFLASRRVQAGGAALGLAVVEFFGLTADQSELVQDGISGGLAVVALVRFCLHFWNRDPRRLRLRPGIIHPVLIVLLAVGCGVSAGPQGFQAAIGDARAGSCPEALEAPQDHPQAPPAGCAVVDSDGFSETFAGAFLAPIGAFLSKILPAAFL